MKSSTQNMIRWGLLFGIAFGVVLLDQVTKALVIANLSLYERWMPIDALSRVFSITYTRNTGAAFGIFQSGSLFFLTLAVIASFAIIYYYRQISTSAWLVRIALGLQLGGALGNAIDRILRGYVVDFIHLYYEPHFDWPIFNFADSSIVIGVFLLVVILWNADKKESQPQEDYSSSQ
jgi:signal peptidase II